MSRAPRALGLQTSFYDVERTGDDAGCDTGDGTAGGIDGGIRQMGALEGQARVG